MCTSSQLLVTLELKWNFICPDWPWTLPKPAQICGAVAGMESHCAADFFFFFTAGTSLLLGPAEGKQGIKPSMLSENPLIIP